MPTKLGYRMPAEWERHEATWLTWPHNPETWPDLKKIESIYTEIISLLTRGERVKLLVSNPFEEEHALGLCAKASIDLSKIDTFQIPTCDAWIRDYGPNFVVSRANGKKELSVNRWIFNAWGSKYEEHLQDDQALESILNVLKLPIFYPEFILEGGSIDTNGAGILLTTEQCLLNSNRNSHLSKHQIELKLKEFLGIETIIWLKVGIAGDDTDGHIDDIARFVSERAIVTIVERNKKDENYDLLQENLKILKKAKSLSGEPLEIVELPAPGKVIYHKTRLPASYANFYIANSVVLVPIFGHENDPVALKILKSFFPGREVIGIRSEDLVIGLGGIHCLTHEEPAFSFQV